MISLLAGTGLDLFVFEVLNSRVPLVGFLVEALGFFTCVPFPTIVFSLLSLCPKSSAGAGMVSLLESVPVFAQGEVYQVFPILNRHSLDFEVCFSSFSSSCACVGLCWVRLKTLLAAIALKLNFDHALYNVIIFQLARTRQIFVLYK